MNRKDLAKLFKLQATILGIGFGATALGLGYFHYKENCANQTEMSVSACMSEIFSSEDENDINRPQP